MSLDAKTVTTVRFLHKKIAFETVDQKVSVLRAKANLKTTKLYNKVSIFGSKTHTERILELNAKTILNEIPNGNAYRVTANGRIVKKDYPNPTQSASNQSG